MKNGIADRATLDTVQEELISEMDAAVQFAVDAPYPDPSKVDQDIYA
jgi:TPP-dependent pyruvate/acetoin dehydrogenase alpha subunit